MKRLFATIVMSLLPCAVFAEGLGLGVRAGLVKPEGMDVTFAFGAFGTYEVMPHLELKGAVDYWTKSWTVPPARIHMERKKSELTFSGLAQYSIPLMGSPADFGVGVGFGVHILYEKLSAEDPQYGEINKSSAWTKLGLHFSGELGVPVSPKLSLLGRVGFGVVENHNSTAITVGLVLGI